MNYDDALNLFHDLGFDDGYVHTDYIINVVNQHDNITSQVDENNSQLIVRIRLNDPSNGIAIITFGLIDWPGGFYADWLDDDFATVVRPKSYRTYTGRGTYQTDLDIYRNKLGNLYDGHGNRLFTKLGILFDHNDNAIGYDEEIYQPMPTLAEINDALRQLHYDADKEVDDFIQNYPEPRLVSRTKRKLH